MWEEWKAASWLSILCHFHGLLWNACSKSGLPEKPVFRDGRFNWRKVRFVPLFNVEIACHTSWGNRDSFLRTTCGQDPTHRSDASESHEPINALFVGIGLENVTGHRENGLLSDHRYVLVIVREFPCAGPNAETYLAVLWRPVRYDDVRPITVQNRNGVIHHRRWDRFTVHGVGCQHEPSTMGATCSLTPLNLNEY
jgi:hypothetical protein